MQFTIEECPLIVEGCTVAHCHVVATLAEYDGEIFCTDMSISAQSIPIDGDERDGMVVLEGNDKDHQYLFSALSEAVIEMSEEKFREELRSPEYLHSCKTGEHL